MRSSGFKLAVVGLILSCALAGCGRKGETPGKGAAPRAVTPEGPEESAVEEALTRLEAGLTKEGRAEHGSELVVTMEKKFPAKPGAQDYLMASSAYLSSMDYRHALAAFQRAQALDPNMADPQWGRAVVLYNVAVLDMTARGRAKIEKRSREDMARVMAEQTYRRREALLLAKGYRAFRGVRSAMVVQGWTEGEAVGAMLAALAGAPGTPDDPEMARMAKTLAKSMPHVAFQPDESALALLRLADAQFRLADGKPGFEGARHRFFFRPDMRSVHGRVEELLGGTQPSKRQP